MLEYMSGVAATSPSAWVAGRLSSEDAASVDAAVVAAVDAAAVVVSAAADSAAVEDPAVVLPQPASMDIAIVPARITDNNFVLFIFPPLVELPSSLKESHNI